MQHINDIAQEILKAEGRFVNDPDDPGRPNKLRRHAENT
jgi:lysozyme family protein